MNINNLIRPFHPLLYKNIKNINRKLWLTFTTFSFQHSTIFTPPILPTFNNPNNNSHGKKLLSINKNTKYKSYYNTRYTTFYYKDIKSKERPRLKNMADGQKKKGAKEEKCMLLRLIASSITIANRSGNIIRKVMSGGNLQIVDKGINDLQTEADRRVQKCILASLHHKFPNLTVIGEEEDTFEDSEWIEEGEDDEVYQQEKNFPPQLLSADQNNLCVWVDPLDGTNEYTKGHLDHVTVLIGIAVDGRAVAGVIHQPYYKCSNSGSIGKCSEDAANDGNTIVKLGRTIWGVVGLGAFGLTRQAPPTDCRRIVTTRSHETHLVRMAVDACEASEVIKIGGAGFKVLYLIEGKAHAYIFANTGCKKWDTCAPEAVLRSVGGVLTDVRGTDIKYGSEEDPPNNGGIVATASKETHDWYIERIPEAVKVGLNV